MKKVIVIIMLFTIMTGCGKTARLESLEREREAQIAAEQARIEAARLANRSFLKKSWDHIWTHKLGYGLGALVVAGILYTVSYFRTPPPHTHIMKKKRIYSHRTSSCQITFLQQQKIYRYSTTISRLTNPQHRIRSKTWK